MPHRKVSYADSIKHPDYVFSDIFRRGKFICTITANLVLLGVTCWFANISVFIASNYCCYYKHYRYLNLLVTPISIFVVSILYVLFYLGYAARKPLLWVKIDICCKLILTTLTLISNILAMNTCKVISNVHKSPGPIGIMGCVCLFLSCCSLFILYRYKEMEEEMEASARSTPTRKLSRMDDYYRHNSNHHHHHHNNHIDDRQRKKSVMLSLEESPITNLRTKVEPVRKSSLITNRPQDPRKVSPKSVHFVEPQAEQTCAEEGKCAPEKAEKCQHCDYTLKPSIII